MSVLIPVRGSMSIATGVSVCSKSPIGDSPNPKIKPQHVDMQPLPGLFPAHDPRKLQICIPSGDSHKPIVPALAGYQVYYCPCMQPMHHSVLPEVGGVKPQGRSLSSRQALPRESRIAKRNLRLARVGTGGVWCALSVSIYGKGVDLRLRHARNFGNKIGVKTFGEHVEGELACSFLAAFFTSFLTSHFAFAHH